MGRRAGYGKLHPDQIAFRSVDLLPSLTCRTDRCETSEHTIARRDLLRYYALLEDSMPEVSEKELAFLCEVVTTDDHRQFLDDVLNASNGTAEKHGVNTSDLSLRLRKMNLCQVLALLDTVERLRLL